MATLDELMQGQPGGMSDLDRLMMGGPEVEQDIPAWQGRINPYAAQQEDAFDATVADMARQGWESARTTDWGQMGREALETTQGLMGLATGVPTQPETRQAGEDLVAGTGRGAVQGVGKAVEGLGTLADSTRQGLDSLLGPGPEIGISDSMLGTTGDALGAAGEGIQWLGETEALTPDDPDHFAGKLGTGLGSMAAFLGTGLAGRAAAGGRALGAYAGSGGMASAVGAQESYDRAMRFIDENPELGMTREDALAMAPQGIVPGLVQVANLGVLLRPLSGWAKKGALNKITQDLVAAAASEFTVESAGAVMQNALERQYNADRELMDGALEQGGYAALSALLMRSAALPYTTREADPGEMVDETARRLAGGADPQTAIQEIESEVDAEAMMEGYKGFDLGQVAQAAPQAPEVAPQEVRFDDILAEQEKQSARGLMRQAGGFMEGFANADEAMEEMGLMSQLDVRGLMGTDQGSPNRGAEISPPITDPLMARIEAEIPDVGTQSPEIGIPENIPGQAAELAEQPQVLDGPRGTSAITEPVTDEKLPELKDRDGNWQRFPDPRLKRRDYREALSGMLNELERGGGVALVPREGASRRGNTGDPLTDYDATDLRRTPSTNPRWFQSLSEDTGLTVDKVKSAARKALEGGKLGNRQADAVSRMLEEVRGRRIGADSDTGPDYEGLQERLHEAQADPPEVTQVRDRVKSMKLSDPVQVAMNAVGDEGRTMESLNDLSQEVRGAERALMKKYGVKSMETLEDAPLTESDRNFLYYDDAGIDTETVNAMRAMIEPVERLVEAKFELRRVASRLPETSDVDAMSDLDKEAVGRLMFLGSEIQRLGGNAHEALHGAVLSEAARHRDPEDAEFMARNMVQRLAQFVDLGPQAAVTDQRQAKALADQPATETAPDQESARPQEAERPPAEEAPPDQPAQESTETPPDGGVSRSGPPNTPEFRRWFGNSRVADEAGEPRVVYHGAAEEFTAFDPEMVGAEFGQDGRGFFFTDRRETAEEYAQNAPTGLRRRESGPVVDAYLSLQNPHIVRVDRDPISEWDNRHAELQTAAEASGNDGIIIEADQGENLYVAFRPEQIKSATGNTGTFDPDNPDIRYSRGEGIDQTAQVARILSGREELFQLPKPEASDMAGIFAELNSDITVEATETPTESGLRQWDVTMPDGRGATLLENVPNREVWLDASTLNAGESGGRFLYAGAAGYAYNNGRRFVGDPNGLSEPGHLRRTENLISSAIKYGTTRHLEPHQRQREQRHAWERPIQWRVEESTDDYFHNLRELLESSYHNIRTLVPEIEGISYNFERRRFEDENGQEYADDDFKALAGRVRKEYASGRTSGRGGRFDPGSGASGRVRAVAFGEGTVPIGRTTLKRAALTNTLVREASGQRWRSVLGEVARQYGEGLDPALRRTFYSQTETPAPAGVSGSGVSDVTGWLGLNRGRRKKLTDSGLVRVVQSVPDIPGQHPADVPAAYHEGTVYLVADNIRGQDHARGLLLHELGVHHGLRGMIGPGRYDSLVDQLKTQVARGGREGAGRAAREAWEAHQRALADDTIRDNPEALWEETVAYMAEAGSRSTIIERMVAAVKRFLRDLGLDTEFTAADLAGLARGSVRRMVDGVSEETGTSYAPAYSKESGSTADQTQTPEFRRWFGDSKVVDESGNPVAVYHGTKSDISAFESDRAGSATGAGSSELGFFFSDAPGRGEATAGGRGAEVWAGDRMGRFADGSNIMPVYLSIQNPKRLSNRDITRAHFDGQAAQVRAEAEAEGHDGLIIQDGDEAWHIAFRPEQIKSATGNTGAFDPSNPDTRYSRTENGFVSDPANPDQPARPGKEIFSTTVYLGRDSNGKAIHAQTSDPSLKEQGALKKHARRLFTKEGLLTPQAFARHIETHGLKNADEVDVQFLTHDVTKRIKRAYGKQFWSSIPRAEMEKMNEYLAGEKVEGLRKDVRDALDVYRGALDGMSARLQTVIGDEIRFLSGDMNQDQRVAFLDNYQDARNGDDAALEAIEALPHGEQIARRIRLTSTIEENKGHYLNRSYRVFDGAKWRPDTDVLERARTLLRKQVDGNPEFSDLTDKAKDDHVEGIINSILNNNSGGLVEFLSSDMLGRKDLSILKRRKEIAPEIRELMGEYKDPRLNFARSMTKMSALVANHHFLSKVREDGLGAFLSTRQSGLMSVQIAQPGDPTMLPMGGLWSTPDFAEAMRDYVKSGETEAWLRAAYGLNASVKYGKTVLSPTTSFRNFWSASTFTVMNGHFNYRHSLKAAQHTWADLASRNMSRHDYIRKLAKLGVLHDNPRAAELEAAMDDAMDMDPYAGGMIKRGVKVPFNIATRIYRAGDDFWKIIGFENEKANLIKAGMSEAEAEKMAADRIRNGYPTYSMVPAGIRWIRKFPAAGTFVSFPWEMMRTTGHQFRFVREDLQAGRKSMAAKRMVGMSIAGPQSWALSAVLAVMYGIDGEEDDAIREMAAPWQRNAQFAYMPPDEEGSIRYLDLSHMDPYSYLKMPLVAIMNGNNETVMEKTGQALKELLEPFLGPDIAAKALGEAIFNKKPDTGASVYDDAAPGSEKWKEGALHVWESIRPGFLDNADRLLKAWHGHTASYGKKYAMGDELWALIGFRITTSDPETSIKFRGFDFNDQKRGASRPVYRQLRSFNPVSETDMRKAVRSTYSRWREAFQGMHDAIRAAKVSGMSEDQIGEVLSKSGVADKHIGPLLEYKTPMWSPSNSVIQNAAQSITSGEVRIKESDFDKRIQAMEEELLQIGRQRVRERNGR